MTFYAGATGAGWIVPKKYVERVGDEGFKKMPIGAGPYRFVSFTPGVELVVEAFDQYWRRATNVKRLVLKSMPDEATRLAALKRGEVHIAYNIRGAMAEEIRRTAGLTLKPNVGQATHWVYFSEQWDPKSPWHDRRVRLAGNHALDRQAVKQAGALGYFRGPRRIIPRTLPLYLQPPRPPVRPPPGQRAAGGAYVYGSYADIDGLFQEQTSEPDPKRREATLHRIQQLIHDKVMVAPVWLNAGLNGVGPRVEESGIGVIAGYAFSAPYEEVKLKGK